MKIRLIKTFRLTRIAVLGVMGALAGVVCSLQPCQAQQTVQRSVTSDDLLKQVNWISGPQTVTIGDLADVHIPQGYRLTDAHGARLILDTLNNPVPDDVVGVLASDSGKWWAVLEYSPKGYVKDSDAAQIDPQKILKQVENRVQTQNTANGASAVTTLNWASLPVYDAKAHSLDWSLQVGTPSARMLNETVVLLGRKGVLQITAVHSSSDALPLKQIIAGNILFKDGERYEDYQSGDKVAEITLPQLITGQKPASPTNEFSGVVAAWVYSGLGACLVLGGLAVVLRRKKNLHRPAPVQTQAFAEKAAVAPTMAASAVANGTSSHHTLPSQKNGGQNGHAQPEAVPAAGNGAKPLSRNRRRKIFDYSKFYTDVVRELTLHSYSGAASVNGRGPVNGRANGYANGNGNGNGSGNGNNGHNGRANGHANGANGSGMNDALKVEIEKLIATQKNLIEEQKCLLEQQTKLIAEKRWLIEEQTAFLKNQSMMMSEDQYPLKLD